MEQSVWSGNCLWYEALRSLSHPRVAARLTGLEGGCRCHCLVITGLVSLVNWPTLNQVQETSHCNNSLVTLSFSAGVRYTTESGVRCTPPPPCIQSKGSRSSPGTPISGNKSPGKDSTIARTSVHWSSSFKINAFLHFAVGLPHKYALIVYKSLTEQV
jgi:hypothetical protein